MLNCLAAAIPGGERVVSAEEVYELRFPHPDCTSALSDGAAMPVPVWMGLVQHRSECSSGGPQDQSAASGCRVAPAHTAGARTRRCAVRHTTGSLGTFGWGVGTAVRARAALVAAATLAGLLLAPPTGDAAAPLCQGKEATIVVADGNLVTGTEGPDVIVATANSIEALGGDDLICIYSGGVSAGDGDDSVLVIGTDPHSQVFAILGPGDDRFVGGPGPDIVDFVGDDCDAVNCDDYSRGADIVSTGAGRDTVESGVLDEPNHDVVDLGTGADRLAMGLPAGSVAQGQGGTGRDTLSFYGGPVDHSVDLNTGVVTLGGVPAATFAGFDEYVLYVASPGALQLLGTPLRDRLDIAAARVDIHLGDGNDSLLLQPTYGHRMTGVLDLGGGSDHVSALSGWRLIAADLARERLILMPQPQYRGRLSLIGTEHFDASAKRIVLRGTPGANTLRASVACHVRLRGGAGADDLSVPSLFNRHPCLADLAGGAGRDLLTGGWSDDRLVGGPGRDVARGAQGTDTCVAEHEFSCEL